MKKVLFAFLSASILTVSCSKDDPIPVAPVATKYMNTSAGSTWNYAYTDILDASNNYNYTVTSTNRDTTAVGKSFHVYDNTTNGNEYYNVTGNDYYTMQAFNLGTTDTTILNLYLKTGAAVNTSWSQNISIDAGLPTPVTITITNKIQETGLTKTVGANTYTNVIHVVTSISSLIIASLPGSSFTNDIHFYYAPNYGMIQNDTKLDLVVPLATIDIHTNTSTKLLNATLL
jgi:hypothetical protein